MQLSKWSGLVLFTLAIPVIAQPVQSLRAEPPRLATDTDDCEDIARAIRNANEEEAQADFWLALARHRNESDDDAEGVRLAKDGLKEALALAREQFQARLVVCDELGDGPYRPRLDPSEFSTTIDNSFSPLVPGRTLVYEGDSADGPVRNEVTAGTETLVIGGFLVRPVEDVVLIDGVMEEHATDWYAQRNDGDIWYFGEISRNYEDGLLDNVDGSWRTGKDGAQPGIAMLAHPKVGDFYRQEYLINVAEDVARVVSIDETVTVKYGTFKHCLQVEERNAMEPDAREWKFYAPGIGLVLVLDLETGERLELVAIQ